jgi:hypothetical protein
MLDNTGVFGASSYAGDAPDGYTTAVAEVVKEKEDQELAKIKERNDKIKAAEDAKKAEEDAKKAAIKAQDDAKK